MLIKKDITSFVDATASNEPVPGGGSVAALSGALAAALAEMVGQLTIGKKKYVEVEDEMKAMVESLNQKRMKLVELIDKDASSYDDVMKAFKLPKETEEDKALRSHAIQEGTKYAASVPLETAVIAFSIMDDIKTAVTKGNTNTISDGGVAAMMARTAVLSALMNVKINLNSIKDSEFVKDMMEKVVHLEAQVTLKEREILDCIKF
jgi:formiminotetrahydrofolate cyclodeaminase